MDMSAAIGDRDVVRESLDKGDRLMYAADNFADRSFYIEAKAAFRRIEEREIRLLTYFQATAPHVAADGGRAMVESVEETLGPEWFVPDPAEEKVTVPPSEEE